MTKNFKKITLSVATSAILVGNAFALDPAITNFGYVGGNGIPLSIFDASDPTKIKSITGLDYSVATAIDPTGKYFYVTDYYNNNVTKYDALTGAVVSGATVTVDVHPVGIALNSDGSKAYVKTRDNVSVIDTSSDNIISTIDIQGVGTVVLNQDNSIAYVTSENNGTFSVIDTTSNTVLNTMGVNSALGIVLNSDSTIAYISNFGNNTVSVIDTTSNSLITTINVGNNPFGLAISLDDTKLYVSIRGSNSVSIIDTTTNSVIQTITGIDSAYGLSISPDGSTVYVRSCYTDKLFTINTSDNSVTTYTGFGTNFTYNISPFISPNLITGTLEASSSAELEAKGFTNYVNFAGGTLRATGSFVLSNPIYLHDEFDLTWDDSTKFETLAGGTVDTNGYNVEFSGEVSGVGGLTKTGTGVLTLSGTNTYSGGTTINGGLINFATADNFGSGNITIDGGGLQWASGSTVDISARLEAIGAGGATFDTNANNVTLASVLSGTGRVTKSGDGILTLSGTNTYSGGTTVTSGTLRGTTSSLQGDILNNALVEFAQSFDGTFGDVISGSGGLTKSSNGILTLSGTNTYTGDTTINAGTVAITGSTTTSDFIVNNGGVLRGSGSVGTTTIKSGAVLYPTNTSTLNIVGNLTFENGSIYRLDAKSDATSGKVAVTGTANLDGTVEVKADNSGTWNTTTNYEILTASILNGTFDSVSSDLAFLTPTLSYEADKVNLTLTRNTVEYKEKATNSQSYKSASVLDEVSNPNTTMQSLFTVLDGMNDTQAATALNRLSGAPLAINTIHSIPTNLSTFSSAVFARLSRANTIGLGGLMFADGDDSMYNTYKILHDGGYMDENGFIKDKPQYSYWTRVIGAKSKLDGDSIRSATDSTTKGIQVGVEKATNDLIIGTSFAYMGTDVDFADNEAKSDVKTYILGFYGQKTFDNNTFINLETNLSQNSTETSRLTPTGWASSKPKSNSLSATLEVGYKYETSKDLFIKPSIIGGYSHIEQKGYTESGAGGANLSIDKYKADISNLGLNLKVQKIYTQNNKDIADIEFGMGYIRDFGDTNKALNASFASTPSAGNFAINGIEKDKNKYTANITTNYYLNKTTNIFAAVNGMKSSNERTLNGFVGIKVGF